MPQTYEEKKNATRERQAALAKAGRDIAPVPKVSKPKRKKSCEKNFRLYCETYFPAVFNLKWSPDHLKSIDSIEKSVLEGGNYAIAMPRGSGKTSLCIAAVLWALLYGHRSFVVLIAVSATRAAELCVLIKSALETSDLLLQDFPEVCYPIRRLQRITNRAAGQTCNGKHTFIHWTSDEIVLPTICKSKASGSVVRCAGIGSGIRGLVAARPSDGQTIRPDLCIIDDPQTDDSAYSPKQNKDLLNIISGAILGLAGPKKKIACVMPCTVICKGDMVDEILNSTSDRR